MIVSDVRILRPGCWTGRQASVAAGGEGWSGGGEQAVPSQHRDQRCRVQTQTETTTRITTVVSQSPDQIQRAISPESDELCRDELI